MSLFFSLFFSLSCIVIFELQRFGLGTWDAWLEWVRLRGLSGHGLHLYFTVGKRRSFWQSGSWGIAFIFRYSLLLRLGHWFWHLELFPSDLLIHVCTYDSVFKSQQAP